jgi:hypothetical protein
VMWSAALSNPVLLGRSRQKELAGILANRSIGWDTASVRRTGRGTASSVAQGAGGDRLHVRPAVHQGLEKPPIQFLSIFNRRHPQCLGVALRAEPVANPRERRACPSPHGGGRVEADRRPAPPAPRTECIRRPAAGRWMWRSRTRAGGRTSVGPRRAKPVPLLVAQGELGDHLDVLCVGRLWSSSREHTRMNGAARTTGAVRLTKEHAPSAKNRPPPAASRGGLTLSWSGCSAM